MFYLKLEAWYELQSLTNVAHSFFIFLIKKGIKTHNMFYNILFCRKTSYTLFKTL